MDAMNLLVDEYIEGNSEDDSLQAAGGNGSIDNGRKTGAKSQVKPVNRPRNGRQPKTQEAITLQSEALGQFPDLVVAASPNRKEGRSTRKQSVIHEANKRK